VFLSYRRDDAAPWAGRLSDALTARFGDGSVFLDVTGVRPGTSFGTEITTALDRCDVALAVIGPRWTSVLDDHGEPRLANPDDYVRRELAIALDHSIPTIPVLVGGAALPDISRLPEELQPLVLRQAIELRDESWHDDVERLARSLRGKPTRTITATGTPPWLAAAAIVLVIAAVAVGGLMLLRSHGDGGDDGADDVSSTASSQTTFDAVNASLPSCESPLEPTWSDLGLRGESTEGEGAGWHFETTGVFVGEVAGGWAVIVETTATNRATGSQTHYPFYSLLANGTTSSPWCNRVTNGDRLTAPGASSTSLTGFQLDEEPIGAMSLDVDSGTNYRIDLVSTG